MSGKNKKSSNDGTIATNRRARFDYEIIDTYEAGIMLTGSEVKSLRNVGVKLDDAHAQSTENGEIEIVNLHITEYKQSNNFEKHITNRKRKLLLHKREIKKILSSIAKDGLTAVPIKMYFNEKGIAKMLLGLAKGKRAVDKRNTIKDREWKVSQSRTLKNYNN